MYKFINSKGKQLNREQSTNSLNTCTSSYFLGNPEYKEPRLPRYVTNNHHFYRKRLSAIDKIQEELREMKQREDELRSELNYD